MPRDRDCHPYDASPGDHAIDWQALPPYEPRDTPQTLQAPAYWLGW